MHFSPPKFVVRIIDSRAHVQANQYVFTGSSLWKIGGCSGVAIDSFDGTITKLRSSDPEMVEGCLLKGYSTRCGHAASYIKIVLFQMVLRIVGLFYKYSVSQPKMFRKTSVCSKHPRI